MDKTLILKKLQENRALTSAEERFYLIEILGYTPEEAETIITINENKDPDVIID